MPTLRSPSRTETRSILVRRAFSLIASLQFLILAYREASTTWNLAPQDGNDDIIRYQTYAHHYRLTLWSILLVILISSLHHVWLIIRLPKLFPPPTWPTLAAKALPLIVVLWAVDYLLIPYLPFSPMNQRVFLSFFLLLLYTIMYRKALHLLQPTSSRHVDLHSLHHSLQSTPTTGFWRGLSSPFGLWALIVLTITLSLMVTLKEQAVLRPHRDSPVRLTDLNNAAPFHDAHPSGLTSSRKPVRILVLVISSWADKSTLKRKTFRETSMVLANHSQHYNPSSSFPFSPPPSTQVEHRFVLGIPPSASVIRRRAKEIREEAAEFGDLLLVSTSDRYEDLSRKLYAGLEWSVHSGNASAHTWDYLIKTDDDIFARLDTLSAELARLHPQPGLWQGQAWWNIPPILEKDSRNAAKDYPLTIFPPFTSGALTILAWDVVARLVEAGPDRLYTRNEDQSLGIWLYPLGYRPKNDRRIQQEEVCEEDMLAKHFADRFSPSPGPYGMLDNILKGDKGMCHGFRQDLCAPCYPCASGTHHYHEWNFSCDPVRGISLLNPPHNYPALVLPPDEDMNGPLKDELDPSTDWAGLGSVSEANGTIVWVTWWDQQGHLEVWGKKETESVASLLFHQPGIRLRILSPHLSPNHLPRLWTEAGYDVRIVWPRTTKEAEEALTSAGSTSRQWYIRHILGEGRREGGGIHIPKAIRLFLTLATAHRYGGVFYTPESIGWVKTLETGWRLKERLTLYPPIPKDAADQEEIKGYVLSVRPGHPYLQDTLESIYTLEETDQIAGSSSLYLEMDPSAPLRHLTRRIREPGMREDQGRTIVLEHDRQRQSNFLSDSTFYLSNEALHTKNWFPQRASAYLSSPTNASFLGPSSLDLSSSSLPLVKNPMSSSRGSFIPFSGVDMAIRWTGPSCPPPTTLLLQLHNLAGTIQVEGHGVKGQAWKMHWMEDEVKPSTLNSLLSSLTLHPEKGREDRSKSGSLNVTLSCGPNGPPSSLIISVRGALP